MFKSVSAFLFFCIAVNTANSEDGTARGIGSGILFPAPNLATVVNPAASTDSPKLSLMGLYRSDPKLPFISLTTSGKIWGAGASYREEPNDRKIIEGSVGLRGMFILLGGTYRTVTDERSDFDASLMFDLEVFRIGAVARGLDNGANRIDVGAALRLSDNAYVEANAKQYDPYDGDVILLDLSAVMHLHDWTLGAGVDAVLREKKVEDQKIHAGVSLKLLEQTYVDAHYRLHEQEWSADNWSFALRILL